MRSAITLLLSAGKIVLPEALVVLKEVDKPVELAKSFLEQFPEKHEVTQNAFHIIDGSISKKKTKKTVPTKIKFEQKRETQGVSRKEALGSVPHRTKKSLNITSSPQTNQGKLKELTKQHKQILKTKSLDVDQTTHRISTSLDDLQGLHNYESDLVVLDNYIPIVNFGTTVGDLINYFQDRYTRLSRMFRHRMDIINITKIKDLSRTESQISVIGMLTEKIFYPGKSGRIIIEDPTKDKELHVIIPRNNPSLQEEVLQIMNDSVICVTGFLKQETLIATEVLLPEIPLSRNRNHANIPVHVAYLSDIHVGSHNFLSKPFERFIDFLNGKYGGKKLQALGKQTKYVMFGGDVVDGVGIYPGQIDDLKIHSIRDQYSEFSRFLEGIPEDVQIVIIPGNHDMVRSAEPQPSIDYQYTPELANFENIQMLSNPSQISIHGVQSLLYHCTSLPDIINNVPGLSINRPVDVMKQMLRARHLAPMWGAKTPIVAETKDYLVIERIPDVFHGGHIHINGEGQYRGVQIVNSGTMQSQTSFQKSLNIDPTPGQVALLNLKSMKWNRLMLK
ncbi:MAG: DNA polymerase II small subunit [Candidatus Heimdallarchaeota archaeon LC_2]|nr:MAG: DNA polymerase II small subunit [Candidatus Heimdallarchaeota archaeon LC_2]